MALPDAERRAFIEVATKMAAWRESAELKVRELCFWRIGQEATKLKTFGRLTF
jgi:hypothetical protein